MIELDTVERRKRGAVYTRNHVYIRRYHRVVRAVSIGFRDTRQARMVACGAKRKHGRFTFVPAQPGNATRQDRTAIWVASNDCAYQNAAAIFGM